MIVFDGKEIIVRSDLSFGTDVVIFSFTSRNGHLAKYVTDYSKVSGEAENFLKSRSLSAVYFISKRNHWWQTEEMFEAIGRLKASGLLAAAKERVAYGLSMGGYASLMFSKALDATRVVSISPQYSMDLARAPFEWRWEEDRKSIDFIYDDMETGLVENDNITVMYDPDVEVDRYHAHRILSHSREGRPIHSLPVLFGGHAIRRALSDMGMLGSTMEQLLRGQFDHRRFREKLRRNRRDSHVYYSSVAHCLERRKNKAGALPYAKVAVDLLCKKLERDPEYYRDRAHTFDAEVTISKYLSLLAANGRQSEGTTLLANLKERFGIEWSAILRVRSLFDAGEHEVALDLLNEEIALGNEQQRELLRFALTSLQRFGSAAQLLAFVEKWRAPILADAATAVSAAGKLARYDVGVQPAVDIVRELLGTARPDLTADLARRCLVLLGRCGEFEEARTRLKALGGLISPDDAEVLLKEFANLEQRGVKRTSLGNVRTGDLAALFESGDPAVADARLRQMIEAGTDRSPLLKAAVHALYKREDGPLLDRFAATWSADLAAVPELARFALDRLAKRGLIARAVELLSKAPPEVLEDLDTPLIARLVGQLAKAGDQAGALLQAERFSRVPRLRVGMLELIGQFHKAMKHPEEEIATWSAILEATGGRHVRASEVLAMHHLRRRDFAAALQYAEKGLAVAPDNAALLSLQAKALAASGQRAPVGARRLGLALVCLLAIGLWASTGFYRVGPDQQGVVLRFGQQVDTTGPGLHYHLPIPIESVEMHSLDGQSRVEVGALTAIDSPDRDSANRNVAEPALTVTA